MSELSLGPTLRRDRHTPSQGQQAWHVLLRFHLDEAEALADRIVVLRRGRLVADGTASELAALVGGQRLVLSDAEGRQVRSIETDGSAASVGAAVAALGDEERQLHINLRQPSLDDAFVALTAGDREVAA